MKKIISLLMAILLVTSIGAFRTSAETAYIAVQNSDGSITISYAGDSDGTKLSGYANPTFTDLEHNAEYYRVFDNLNPVISQSKNYVNVFGPRNCWAYDYVVSGASTNNIIYDEATDSITLTAEWVNSTLSDGSYSFSVCDGINWSQTSPIEIKVVNNGGNNSGNGGNGGNNHNDYYYELVDGEYSFRYGVYYFNDDGSLFSTLWGDAEAMAGKTDNVILGVGSYQTGASEVNTATNAPIDLYNNIDEESVFAFVMDGNMNEVSPKVVSVSEKQNITILGVNTYKFDVLFSEEARDAYYVYICFKLKGDDTLHRAYRKYIVKNNNPIRVGVDMSDQTLEDLSNIISNIYEFGIKPTTGGPQGAQTYEINLVNVPDKVFEGNLVINLSPNNQMDFNGYRINGNGIKMNGSIINEGKTPMVMGGFEMDGSTNQNADIAVYPKNGDINISEFLITNYKYGVFAGKSPDPSTIWAGNCYNVQNVVFKNCTEAGIYIGNNKNYNGMNFSPTYIGDAFINCSNGVVIEDVPDGVNTIGVEISYCRFMGTKNKDFVVNHSSREEDLNRDEYFIFASNYYSSQVGEYTNNGYRSAKISKSGDNVIVSTSPALMFPESNEAKLGIDSGEGIITTMFSGVRYNINSKSKFAGANITLFDPKSNLPVGTAKIKGDD